MRKTLLIIVSLFVTISVFSSDFVNQFIEKYGEVERPLKNVNIGKTMLDQMAENTSDEELKAAFKDLNSIRIVSSDNQEDSKHYFDKAIQLVDEAFSEYQEVASVNENMSKISVFMKRESDDKQDLILITLDANSKFSVITVSGKIDFNSISKLSGTLKDEAGIQ